METFHNSNDFGKLMQLEELNRSLSILLNGGNEKSWFKKGLILFEFGEFESAKKSFQRCIILNPNQKRYKTWKRKCESEIEETYQNRVL